MKIFKFGKRSDHLRNVLIDKALALV